ncbi:hypothetical protein GCM10009554_37000 [Kribbella koreensis]|uniref:Uncharacterized protein n=1 Tax=Kribbella koreensis TaxID=57909 RepID=A0ABP4AZC6_9ACTN
MVGGGTVGAGMVGAGMVGAGMVGRWGGGMVGAGMVGGGVGYFVALAFLRLRVVAALRAARESARWM